MDWLVDGEGPIRGCCLTFARCLILSLVTSISANRWNNLRTNIPLSNVSSPRNSHKTFYARQNARANVPRDPRSFILCFDLGRGPLVPSATTVDNDNARSTPTSLFRETRCTRRRRLVSLLVTRDFTTYP